MNQHLRDTAPRLLGLPPLTHPNQCYGTLKISIMTNVGNTPDELVARDMVNE